jgi:hypothetical protein
MKKSIFLFTLVLIMISYVSADPLVDALEQADSDSVQGIALANELTQIIRQKEGLVQREEELVSEISSLLWSIGNAMADWKTMCESEGWDWTQYNERLIVNVDIILQTLSSLGYQVSF